MAGCTEEKERIYKNDLNYLEEYVHEKGQQCYIFFSSHGLYDDISAEEIRKTLVEKDRYEWRNIANSFKYHKNLGKIIYVRDVFKVFYLYGINNELDSIDKIINKLRELTVGYEITTVGISSGGYMAVIAAMALKAKRSFCFSGQFDISERLQDNDLMNCKSVYEKRKYINIVDLLIRNPMIPVFYFCPIGCGHDYQEYMRIKGIQNVKPFLFPDKIHASTVYPFNFPDILFMSNDKLERLSKVYKERTINKRIFYLRTVTIRGFYSLVSHIWKTKFRLDSLKRKWTV